MTAYDTVRNLSTTNKASIVAGGLGHRPYQRHRHTGEVTLDHTYLANDRPVTRTVCIFTTDGETT